MVACSQQVVEIGSILGSFWRSKSLLHRFLRDSKKQQKPESIFSRFGMPKRAPKSFQNRSFFVVFPGPCFGGSASRFLIDFWSIWESFLDVILVEFKQNVRHAWQLLINVLYHLFASVWCDSVAENTEIEIDGKRTRKKADTAIDTDDQLLQLIGSSS